MSQFDDPSTSLGGLRSVVKSMLSRLNRISTAGGKIRSDADGTFRTGVQRKHTHLGQGAGGNLIAGVTPNFMTVTRGPPQVIDDSSLGFQIGSQWIDTRANAHYICFAATVGAAVWKVSTTIDSTTESFAPRRPPVRWPLHRKPAYVTRARRPWVGG